MRQGDKVRLCVPGNPRLHGALGIVDRPTDYGAVVSTRAAATGEFRALTEEMVGVDADMNGAGYSGDVCGQCGSVRVRQAGSCKVCDDCGSNSGCG